MRIPTKIGKPQGREGQGRQEPFCVSLVSGVRGAVNAVGYFQDHESQLQQNSYHENTDEEGDDTYDQIDEPFRGGALHADDDINDDGDSATEDGKKIEQLDDATREQRVEREIKKAGKEILFLGHEASWQKIQDAGLGRGVGKAIRRDKSRHFECGKDGVQPNLVALNHLTQKNNIPSIAPGAEKHGEGAE
jgi:hypothetical protein